MSRELKFRAYDSATGKVSEPFDVKESWGDYLIDFGDYSSDGALDFIIWEQYTGLKDKNGKEIYENDVMKYDACLYRVFWYKGGFTFEPIGEHGWTSADVFSEGKVVGNIHNNPELLEGRNK